MLAMIKRLPAIRARQLSHCYRKKVRARRTCRSADHICSASRAPRWFAWANVRFGSEPDNKRSRSVRFTPQEGTLQARVSMSGLCQETRASWHSPTCQQARRGSEYQPSCEMQPFFGDRYSLACVHSCCGVAFMQQLSEKFAQQDVFAV